VCERERESEQRNNKVLVLLLETTSVELIGIPITNDCGMKLCKCDYDAAVCFNKKQNHLNPKHLGLSK
jgi:hypothetical protein